MCLVHVISPHRKPTEINDLFTVALFVKQAMRLIIIFLLISMTLFKNTVLCFNLPMNHTNETKLILSGES